VALRISYKDSLDSSQESSISVPATLSSASRLLDTQSTRTSDVFVYAEYAIIVAVAAVVVGGVFHVRRSRRLPRPSESEGEEDKIVI